MIERPDSPDFYPAPSRVTPFRNEEVRQTGTPRSPPPFPRTQDARYATPGDVYGRQSVTRRFDPTVNRHGRAIDTRDRVAFPHPPRFRPSPAGSRDSFAWLSSPYTPTPVQAAPDAKPISMSEAVSRRVRAIERIRRERAVSPTATAAPEPKAPPSFSRQTVTPPIDLEFTTPPPLARATSPIAKFAFRRDAPPALRVVPANEPSSERAPSGVPGNSSSGKRDERRKSVTFAPVLVPTLEPNALLKTNSSPISHSSWLPASRTAASASSHKVPSSPSTPASRPSLPPSPTAPPPPQATDAQPDSLTKPSQSLDSPTTATDTDKKEPAPRTPAQARCEPGSDVVVVDDQVAERVDHALVRKDRPPVSDPVTGVVPPPPLELPVARSQKPPEKPKSKQDEKEWLGLIWARWKPKMAAKGTSAGANQLRSSLRMSSSVHIASAKNSGAAPHSATNSPKAYTATPNVYQSIAPEVWVNPALKLPTSRAFHGACVDTGASKTIIGLRKAIALRRTMGHRLALHRTKVRIRFGSGSHHALGETVIPMRIGAETILVPAAVVKPNVPFLLGLDTMRFLSNYFLI